MCSLVASRIAAMGDVLGAIGKLGLYIVTTLCGLFFHALVLLPLIFFVITRKNPYRFLKGASDALITAFGIASRLVILYCYFIYLFLLSFAKNPSTVKGKARWFPMKIHYQKSKRKLRARRVT